MAYEFILAERLDGCALITLNRPEKLNALSFPLMSEVDDALTEYEADDAIKAVILTGAGDRAFSAGADIHEMAGLSSEELAVRSETRGNISWHIANYAKPLIGAINGLAYGGAAVLASSLDMRIGCEDSRFRFLAAAYGRINSTWTLPNQVGWPIAKELLFSARMVEAEEAHRIGLLNHLVPRDQLRAKTLELGRQIAGNNRAAVIGIKQLLLKQMTQDLEQQWTEERDFTTHVVRGARAEEAFPEFIARKGRPLG